MPRHKPLTAAEWRAAIEKMPVADLLTLAEETERGVHRTLQACIDLLSAIIPAREKDVGRESERSERIPPQPHPVENG